MSAITPVNPIYMSNTVLTVEGDDYAAALTSVAITGTQQTVSSKGLKPGARWVRLTAPEYTVETIAHQDDAADSFMTYVRENQGQTKTFVLTPEDGASRTRTVTVIIPALSTVGGAIDAFGLFTQTFPVVGGVTTGELPA